MCIWFKKMFGGKGCCGHCEKSEGKEKCCGHCHKKDETPKVEEKVQ